MTQHCNNKCISGTKKEQIMNSTKLHKILGDLVIDYFQTWTKVSVSSLLVGQGTQADGTITSSMTSSAASSKSNVCGLLAVPFSMDGKRQKVEKASWSQ